MEMEYEGFLASVKELVAELVGDNVQVTVIEMGKNNGVVRKGLMIRHKDSNMAPAVYLEEYYQEFLQGKGLNEISLSILKSYRNTVQTTDFDVERFRNFEQIQEHIVYRIINLDRNRQLLEECPYIPFLDLAVVPYVSFHVGREKNGAVLIKKKHLQLWNVTEKEVLAIAAQNAPRRLIAGIRKMEDTLRELFSVTDEQEQEALEEFMQEIEESEHKIPMYVLSNQINFYGAACMLYEDVMEMFAQELGEDVYILPSSVHEVLLVPVSKALPPKEMLEMVQDINTTQIPPEEILSNHIYQYSMEERGFRML
ncbi:MAG: hypothetical protein K2M46_14000 [Lachnospiraceae bacterium]|nr:hypothetical protein [Lachnospiraceae bacterium]